MTKSIKNIALLGAIGLVALWSCSPQSVPQKNEVIDYSFEDDLSKYRPTFEEEKKEQSTQRELVKNEPLEVSFDISEKMNGVVDTMRSKNDSLRLIDGYTILVYSGNDELQAGRVRNRLFDLVPEWEAKFSYKLPTYFVKIGQFYQQIEAQSLYRKIRNYYPTASIVPDKFKVEND